MSCDHHRGKFFQAMQACGGQVSASELETVFQANRRLPRDPAEQRLAEAKTRRLFAAMSGQGLKPPSHAADGLPRRDAQLGYAAVYDALRQAGLLREQAATPARLGMAGKKKEPGALEVNDPRLGRDGRDSQGSDRWGYDKKGFNRKGKDREGYDRYGLRKRHSNALGYEEEVNRQGWNREGEDADGYGAHGYHARNKYQDRDGYNLRGYKDGYDREGYDPDGYDAQGCDRDGYDRHGYDRDGFDREGLDKQGLDRQGQPGQRRWQPDAQGMYPDGLDAYGFGLDGYDLAGYDRFGFGRDGFNRMGVDRNGYNRSRELAYPHARNSSDTDYNHNGYRYEYSSRSQRREAVDRLGYDQQGFHLQGGRTWTGYDIDALDANGKPRQFCNEKGKLVPVKYGRDGYDENGLDRWGYNKNGLTAPDEHGQQFNFCGWVYDPQQAICVNPQDPQQTMEHKTGLTRRFNDKHPGWIKTSIYRSYLPKPPPPPITPFAPLTARAYRACGEETFYPYDERAYPTPSAQARGCLALTPDSPASQKAARNGVLMRCPECGQFTNGNSHACPSFGRQQVFAYRSGTVVEAGDARNILASGVNPEYDHEYHGRAHKWIGYGYNQDGYDKAGYDMHGYNRSGFDRTGYSNEGYDWEGYDRDGFGRDGFNREGYNRQGLKRGTSLDSMKDLMREENQDLLDNADLARLYGQIATGLVGKPRKVVLRAGAGFATDMQGTIYADPYPLGRHADPRHNMIVTRAGIYHELGHEQFSPQEIWARVLAVQEGKLDEAGLGPGAKSLLPRFYNVVEDGRMERQVAKHYAGAAEVLAASCRLRPRWDERVGPDVPPGEQVFWSLLYTGLPYFRVSDEVRAGLTPRARAVFDELEPLLARAVRGAPEEAYQAAARIAQRFEEEGWLDLTPSQASSRPMPRADAKPSQGAGQPGQGGGQPTGGRQAAGDEEDETGPEPARAEEPETPQGKRQAAPGDDEDESGTESAGDETQETPQADSGEDEDESGPQSAGDEAQETPQAASSAGQDGVARWDEDEEDWLLGEDVITAAANLTEREAASALARGLRTRYKPENFGRALHDRLERAQRYLDENGIPNKVPVELPIGQNNADLEARRPQHREVAQRMSRHLGAIREQVEQRLRRQSSGRLDRRQLVNAYKGLEDIYSRTKEMPDTSFAASISVDMSGSMQAEILRGNLYDAVMTLGDTFDILNMRYEVRAFGSGTAQVKTLNQKTQPDRAASLAQRTMGGTNYSETSALARTSLLACAEKNRMMICLTDGAMSDHSQTTRSLAEARKRGIVTFGIFLGQEDFDAGRMDELFGRGNWTSITNLADMPQAVAQRIANIFRKLA